MESSPLDPLESPPPPRDDDATLTLAKPISIRKQAEALGPDEGRYLLFTGCGMYLGRSFIVVDGGVILLGHGEEILVRVPGGSTWTVVNARLWGLHDISVSRAELDEDNSRGYL